MLNPKDIIVTTTPTLEGIKIIKYLKPISSHIVAGTNLFSDFLGGLSDVFGGRSESYQKQLGSIYNEAITRIKSAAYESGGNGVVGLKIDIDEISGKGKSMFMITAVGTSVIFEKQLDASITQNINTDFSKISFEQIQNLKKKNDILKKIESKDLKLNLEIWKFIIENQVIDIYPELQKRNSEFITNPSTHPVTVVNEFNDNYNIYLNSLPREICAELLFESILETDDISILKNLIERIKNLNLSNYDFITQLLKNNEFVKQKVGLKLATFNKPYYDKADIQHLTELVELIQNSFPERGEKTSKKQMLSSKEKEIWICKCGKSNNLEYKYCNDCYNDIYGFKMDETNPKMAQDIIEERISLIKEIVR